MRFGFPISVLLHTGVLALGVFVLPSAMENRLNESPIIPIELVTLAAKTNIKAKVAKPEPVAEPDLAPAPLVAKVPEPELSKPEPEPVTEKPKPPIKKAEAPKPKPKLKPKPKPKPKPPSFDLARLESKLVAAQTPDEALDQLLQDNQTANEAVGEGTELNVDEVDLLRSQMYRCWRAPMDAPNPERLVVRVKLRLNRDGSLLGAPEIMNLGQIERSKDPFWKAAANSARRAVIKCQPYALPENKYTNWQEMILRFSAADMMRGSTR